MSTIDERKFAFLGSGYPEIQEAMINFFVKLGATNRQKLLCRDKDMYYFIDETNKIDNSSILPEGYTFQLDTYLSVMQNQENKVPEYVECIKSGTPDFVLGKIYNWPEPIDNEGRKRGIDTLDGMLWAFKPSTKEAYDAQNAPKRLKKEDLVAGEIYIYDGTQISTYPGGPSLGINGKNYIDNPKWAWCLTITHATEEQKALLRGEIEKNSKSDVMWPSDPIVEQRINTPSIKKETFIDNVQSVDVVLRTKKKSIKF